MSFLLLLGRPPIAAARALCSIRARPGRQLSQLMRPVHRPAVRLAQNTGFSLLVLRRAVLAAVRHHRPLILRQLVQAQGAERFAVSLQGQSRRVVEDALSMLHPSERCAVLGTHTFDAERLKSAGERACPAARTPAARPAGWPPASCGARSCLTH